MWQYLLFSMIGADFIGNLIAKEWSVRGGKLLAVLSILMFIATNILWLLSLKNGSGLARGVMFYAVGTALLAFLAGVLWYKEAIPVVHLTGAVLGVLAIIFLSQ